MIKTATLTLLIYLASLLGPGIPFLTQQNYDSATIYSEGVVVVEFWARWNAKNAYPIDKLRGAKLYRVDVDREAGLVYELGVEVIPTVYIYANGNLVHIDETDVSFTARETIAHLQEEINKWN